MILVDGKGGNNIFSMAEDINYLAVILFFPLAIASTAVYTSIPSDCNRWVTNTLISFSYVFVILSIGFFR